MDVLPSESLSQALRYSAGVTSEKYGAFGSGIDFSKIRGFDADYYLAMYLPTYFIKDDN